MKRQGSLLILLVLIAPAAARAQDARGFIGAAVSSSVNNEHHASVGGGVTIGLGPRWLSGGAQGEALISWPYVAGRGALFAQAQVANRSSFRPFVMAGMGMGEEAGPLVGGGFEMRERGTRYGFRVTIEDYVTRYDQYGPEYRTGPIARTGHQIAVRGALLF